MRGLGRYYELEACYAGQVDPITGYSLDIKRIDRAVQERVLPYLEGLLAAGSDAGASAPMGQVMRRIGALLQEALGGAVAEVRLALTPFYSLQWRSRDMDRVIVRQQYEFAAAHRLHAAELNDQENRRVFGKCNNPSGHGHNYRVEVAVRVPIDPAGGVTPVEELDAVVDSQVIQKLDHKHLNLDVPQFARLNPSVENITREVYRMLAPAIRKMGAELEEISVWETSKTVCTYRGEDAPAGR